MFKIFKYVMELQRQNTLYKRAMQDMVYILSRESRPGGLKYELDDENLHTSFKLICRFIEDYYRLLEKTQQPSDSSGDTDNGSC
jgi:hypothetical protein